MSINNCARYEIIIRPNKGCWTVRIGDGAIPGTFKTLDEALEAVKDYHKPDWRDQIPWECIVDEVEWVTYDKTYGWKGHNCSPKMLSDDDCFWINPQGRSWVIGGIKNMPQPPADWRQAIARRPE